MSFEWPMALWLLLAVPGLVAAYLWLKRRRKKIALRYASLAVVREALGRAPGWRRHVPPVLLLIAITALIVAAARPAHASHCRPTTGRSCSRSTSLSMRANDIELRASLPHRRPRSSSFRRSRTRARRRSVRGPPRSQPPTQPRRLVAAIDRLELQRHTAIGSGILTSLQTIFPEQAGADRRQRPAAWRAFEQSQGKSLDTKPAPAKKAFQPVPAARTRARRSSC
jgi:Ca-activated chloride channel family protein